MVPWTATPVGIWFDAVILFNPKSTPFFVLLVNWEQKKKSEKETKEKEKKKQKQKGKEGKSNKNEQQKGQRETTQDKNGKKRKSKKKKKTEKEKFHTSAFEWPWLHRINSPTGLFSIAYLCLSLFATTE